uniref:AMP-dependent synthetase/ligase domain-containing protein n=1 Tax=Lactuca sativa TaxID=4236 RepID=A0A9R1XL85_LACSA|nr:hypothetical protein LSAT_V11C300138800 [Lactuca sativa]
MQDVIVYYPSRTKKIHNTGNHSDLLILFAGYYKRDDLTIEVLVDGWFHTGDIGEWQPDGSMTVIDRKKNIFKLSQGEYVVVENLENVFGLFPDLDLIWIFGKSFEACLVAVTNPNKQAIEHYAEAHNSSGDFEALCENRKIKEYVLGELPKVRKENKLKGFEFVKAIHLDSVTFIVIMKAVTGALDMVNFGANC